MSENEYPPIPEGCKRFRREHGRLHFLFAGIWQTVIYCMGMQPPLRHNIADAAIVAWWEEWLKIDDDPNYGTAMARFLGTKECKENMITWRKWRDGEDWK